MKTTYTVYIKTDGENRLTAINSDAFLSDLTGWEKYDEGTGDNYAHAQANYLPLPLVDDRGIYRYKIEDGRIVQRSDAEMDADAEEQDDPVPSDADARIAKLESQLAAYEAAYQEGVQSV